MSKENTVSGLNLDQVSGEKLVDEAIVCNKGSLIQKEANHNSFQMIVCEKKKWY
jgi:hypothetical protein